MFLVSHPPVALLSLFHHLDLLPLSNLLEYLLVVSQMLFLAVHLDLSFAALPLVRSVLYVLLRILDRGYHYLVYLLLL
ncbi:hypothetical protein EW135_12145 [Staphylococcus pseudintermedius]|nr:hypothetical protein EW135_12145 [Staphylococcus pseudintermedius]